MRLGDRISFDHSGIPKSINDRFKMLSLADALAFFTFTYIEAPGIALGRKLVKRLR